MAAITPLLLVSGMGVARWDPLYEPASIEGKVKVDARAAGAVRVLSLNVAHGRGISFHQALTRESHIRRNLDAIARLVRATDADVVALQELDAASAWSGGFDHLAYLAQALDYEHTYHGLHIERSLPRLAYGTGVVSRYPIKETHNHAFDLNKLDTKGFVFTRIEAPSKPFSLVSLHLDFKRESERAEQLSHLTTFLEQRTDEHLVVAGDFNTTLDPGGVLRGFIERHSLTAPEDPLYTFPSTRPLRPIDHIFVRGVRIRTRQTFDVTVSDHLPVLVEIH